LLFCDEGLKIILKLFWQLVAGRVFVRWHWRNGRSVDPVKYMLTFGLAGLVLFAVLVDFVPCLPALATIIKSS
jgi:hypothetical protein